MNMQLPQEAEADASERAAKKTTAIASAVRDEIRALLGEEPFGIAQLTRIADIANAGKSLLQAADRDVVSDLLGRARPSSNQLAGSISLGGGTYNSFETYGAQVLRNLVPALTGQKSSPVALVRALAEARSEGLEDVAEEIREQLRSSVKPGNGGGQTSDNGEAAQLPPFEQEAP